MKKYNPLDDSDELADIVFNDDDSQMKSDGYEMKDFSSAPTLSELDGKQETFDDDDDEDFFSKGGEQEDEEVLGERFVYTEDWRDKWWAVGFLVNFVAMIIFVIVGAATVEWTETGDSYDDDGAQIETDGGYGWRASVIFLSTVITFVVYAVGFMFVLRRYPEQLIYTAIVSTIVMSLINSIMSFAYANSVGFGIFYLILACLFALPLWLWRKRIQFAKYMLGAVGMLVQRYPSTVIVSYISIVPSTLLVFGWMVGVMVTAQFGWPAYFYMLFCLYWIGNTIQNIVHVTASGTFATWYFNPNETQTTAVTWNALKRACSTSFGSIAFGSLIVALVQLLKSLARGHNSIWRLCCGFVERLVRYFNRYAFTQVAVYGKDFITAAKSTFDMFSRSGINAIINDDITWWTMKFVMILCGFLCFLVASLTADALSPFHDEVYTNWYWIVFGFSSMIIGIILTGFLVGIVDSGVATLFVCFAEAPDQLQITDPILYEHFKEHYSDKCDLFDATTAGVVAGALTLV